MPAKAGEHNYEISYSGGGVPKGTINVSARSKAAAIEKFKAAHPDRTVNSCRVNE
ncbi:MAG TPA: hypothetical protein VGH72_33630 [Pseudonocardia sp.]|jgi:hypothetical protein